MSERITNGDGSWDYCVYPAMKAFDAQSHTDKQKQVRRAVVPRNRMSIAYA